MKILSLGALLICLFLTGCVGRKGSRTFLKEFKKIDCCADYSQTQDNVQLCVKAYTEEESQEVFGRNLLQKGVQPLHILVNNNTNDRLTIYPSYIQPEGLPVEMIVPLVKKKIAQYIAPLAIVTWLFQPLLIYIPVQMGLDMRKTNKQIAERLQCGCYTSNEPIVIYPWTSFQKFLFVDREDFVPYFFIRLFNEDQRKLLHFDVNTIGSKNNAPILPNTPTKEQLERLIPQEFR